MVLRLFHILDRDKADTGTITIYDQKLFDTMFMQQTARFIGCRAITHRNHLARHQVCYLLFQIRGKAHITVCQNANQLLRRTAWFFHYRNTADIVGAHHVQRITQSLFRGNRQRIDNHASFKLLDLGDFGGLFLDGEILMHDTKPASLCHGNCQPVLGDRIHSCRNQRDIETDLLGQAGNKPNLSRQHSRMRWL